MQDVMEMVTMCSGTTVEEILKSFFDHFDKLEGDNELELLRRGPLITYAAEVTASARRSSRRPPTTDELVELGWK